MGDWVAGAKRRAPRVPGKEGSGLMDWEVGGEETVIRVGMGIWLSKGGRTEGKGKGEDGYRG